MSYSSLLVNYLPHGGEKKNFRDKCTEERDRFVELYLTEIIRNCILKWYNVITESFMYIKHLEEV